VPLDAIEVLRSHDEKQRMPELTLSMRAHNSERHIKSAIDSVLIQAGVDFELIVIDDASTDNTSAIVKSFQDPRVRLIKNQHKMGAAYCHNLVIDQSRSPFIAHVDSDGVALPGAFQKMLAVCKNSPQNGMVHSYYFEINEDGNVTRDAFRVKRAFFATHLKPDADYKRNLLVFGNVTNHFRTYRKEVFDAVGKFHETIQPDTDYDMALRIVDRFDIKVVPEYLYCHRRNEADKLRSSRTRSLVDWTRRFLHCRRLWKSDRIHFLKEGNYSVTRLLLQGLYDISGFESLSNLLEEIKNFPRILFWKLWIPLVNKLYYFIIIRLSWWPIGLFRFNRKDQFSEEKRIAYYTWHFPVLSQTFIHRELAALKKSGRPVEVIADGAEDREIADENARYVMENAYYLDPVNEALLRRYKRYFFSRKPFSYLNLLFFVMTRRYGPYKNVFEDISVFSKAVYLAGVLRDKKVNHIHAPWSDRCAFIALLAAKLLGATYSVQARAHDIHRKSYLYAFREKFENAEFVVTNTWFNHSYMKTFLDNRHWEKLFVIHNGVDLERFMPEREDGRQSEPIRILCVARLIEQKGLVYLLQACRTLRDKGLAYRCELIGGPEECLYTNYFIELKKLHRRLGLGDSVFFLGSQPFKQVLEKYREADIFILPSVIAQDGSRDITPNALIEAMAMKLPVISTTVTGIPEIVEDGVSGMLVPPNDEKALTDALIKLIQDSDLRKRLGENARKRVEEKFDVNKNINRYIDLFSASDPLQHDHKVSPTATGHNWF
jgi:colanic acid/amylovoran biosynthesis glycosyltransferase